MQALKNPLPSQPKTRSFEKIHITENRFIKLWHDWDKSDMFENNDDYKKVFITLLKSATSIQIKVFKKRRYYILERGSAFTSLRQLAEASQVSIKKVRNAIDRFVEHKAVEVDVKRGIGTIFKVVNYSKYQDKNVRHTSNVISFQKHLDLVKKSNTFNNKAHKGHTLGTHHAKRRNNVNNQQ
jgi:DNA-binding transcriptional regulator YhcF (GntR family)